MAKKKSLGEEFLATRPVLFDLLPERRVQETPCRYALPTWEIDRASNLLIRT